MDKLTWKYAHSWEDIVNIDDPSIRWRFDCNFKLDYDGPLLKVSSRFSPPHKNSHDDWEGDVDIMCAGDDEALTSKTFRCSSLDTLRSEVETHVRQLTEKVQAAVRLVL